LLSADHPSALGTGASTADLAPAAEDHSGILVASRLSTRLWASVAVCVAALPFLRGLSGTRLFYIRDLSLYFWARYLWLRRTLLSGEWPLWDAYVGGGQSAVADALHQMFLLPALLVRLIGNEVLGFNLWVALPFPLAAFGAWGFFSRRFSPAASTLAAIAFTLSGPVVATGNFPNMSWSVAALPWMLWALDRLTAAPTPRRVAVLALAVAFQALAGEPVTLFGSLLVGVGFAFYLGLPGEATLPARLRATLYAGLGILLGLALSAIQLVPMALAARNADRSSMIATTLWSLRPLALIETVAFHLFGDYHAIQALPFAPWMAALNTGREPFFFSIYLGVPLLSLALFGGLAGTDRRWIRFWTLAAAIALVGAFGIYTPVYPFLRRHLPLIDSFRFPVKYLVVVCFAAAAAAAAGWDAIWRVDAFGNRRGRLRRARLGVTAAGAIVSVIAGSLAAACIYFADAAIYRLFSIAQSVRTADPVAAAAFMLHALPRQATLLMLMSLASAGLIFVGATSRREAAAVRYGLFLFIAVDLLIRAWGLNPTFAASYLAEPEWLSHTKADPNARFYVGGKREGTLIASDPDSSRAFLNPPGLLGSASRAALSAQAVFYPSPWHAREITSYDLPVLWPRSFQMTIERFVESGRADRDRFLDRTGVRYRILSDRMAAGHVPLQRIPYFLESSLYDWGEGVARRVDVITDVAIVPDAQQQIDALFQPGWDSTTTAKIEREPPAAGVAGPPVASFANVVNETSNRLTIEAGAGAAGGYLILLDSFADGWRASVDGEGAAIVRANGLFRAVRLVAGRHVVEFAYRPRAFLWGAAISAIALAVSAICLL
jgi:hypothetical protein